MVRRPPPRPAGSQTARITSQSKSKAASKRHVQPQPFPVGNRTSPSGEDRNAATFSSAAAAPGREEDPAPDEFECLLRGHRGGSLHERPWQQGILDIFQTTFADLLSSGDALTATLQAVKQALYDRDFARAFATEGRLAAYAARWSPTRALCYASVLRAVARKYISPLAATIGSVPEEMGARGGEGEGEGRDGACLPSVTNAGSTGVSTWKQQTQSRPSPPFLYMLSVGGGPAEQVAFAACLLREDCAGAVTLLDSAPWGSIVSQLEQGLAGFVPPSPPHLPLPSPSPSPSPSLSSLPSPPRFPARFVQRDALALEKEDVLSLLLPPSDPCPPEEKASAVPSTPSPPPVPSPSPSSTIITFFFTLNELFTSSGPGPTARLLLALTAAAAAGTLLVVVDSPGSYSETGVGRARANKYPMHWLLDRILLERPRGSEAKTAETEAEEARDGDRARGAETPPSMGTAAAVAPWAKLEARDSVWFRLPSGKKGDGRDGGLTYPIPLEDMRYQLHVYRRRDG